MYTRPGFYRPVPRETDKIVQLHKVFILLPARFVFTSIIENILVFGVNAAAEEA